MDSVSTHKDISNRMNEFQKQFIQTNGVISGNEAKEDNEFATYKHTFAEGIYIREMHLKKDSILIGEIQKFDHVIFLLEGTIKIINESGEYKLLSAPMVFKSKGGTQRIGLAVTDVVWINVHPNPTNTEDLAVIEQNVTCENFNEFNKLTNTLTNELG